MLLHLTAPNGTAIELESSSIIERYENDGTYHPKAKSVLALSNGEHQAVQETLKDIAEMIAS